MAKLTKAEQRARQQQRELRNPLTGEAPNSYTQVSNRELQRPTNAQPIKRDVGLQRRTRKAADEHLRGNASDAPMGYRLDGIAPEYRTFATGANHMFPNTAKDRGVPAIDQQHEAHPGVTVQRRAEDLSGKEYRKGEQVLVQYGHDPKNPMESLKEVQRKALDHSVAQHIAAGVQESSSQMFYGGTPTTSGMDPANRSRHETGVMEAHERFNQGVDLIREHPEFARNTEGFSPRKKQDSAERLMAQSAADTSPNSKWRDTKKDGSPAKYPWPNMQQAEEAALAGMENREPRFISGRVDNNPKAAERVRESLDNQDYEMHKYGDPVGSAKTISFRGALVDKDSPDAFKVSDVHESSVVAPWLDTSKAIMHQRVDEQGNKVGKQVPVYKDTPARDRRGLTPLTKTSGTQGGSRVSEAPLRGDSRPEVMLNKGRSTVHALNDHATRAVLSERGLSRGVNYADNVHTMQGATWGMQQVRRPDVDVSPADQYPVTRKWDQEGINVPLGGDIRNMGSTSTNLSRQFGENNRRGRTETIWPEDR